MWLLIKTSQPQTPYNCQLVNEINIGILFLMRILDLLQNIPPNYPFFFKNEICALNQEGPQNV